MTATRLDSTLHTATADFLRRYPPFDQLEADTVFFAASRLNLAYYPKDITILSPVGGSPAYYYIVQRGLVRQTDADTDAIATLGPGEGFTIDALLEGRAVRATYTAATDTFCYLLPAADFDSLLGRSARFREFATSYLASLLRDSHRIQQMQAAATASEEHAANRTLRSLVQRVPVSCPPEASIGDALKAMHQAGTGSVLVVAGDKLEGILTRHDVLDRIALAHRDLNDPVSAVMTPRPTTLPADATSYDAALLIARKGFRHIPVMEGGTIIGVITERDLFALQHVSFRRIRRTMGAAGDMSSLQSAADDIRSLARNLLRQGIAAEQLTHLISTLNDALTERIIILEAKRHGVEGIEWCWLAFGSEGRYEQTISTDQDNGIVFAASSPDDAAARRARLLPMADAVNRALDACGFPLCVGGIMAGNPKWCLTLAEWRTRFERWIANTEPDALLEAVIFFDFRSLYGCHELAGNLRDSLDHLVRKNPVFLRQLARYALESRPPLGFFGAFDTDDHPDAPDTIDLKKAGARLFVDAARVIALAAGVRHTNTAQRLRQAGPRLNLTPNEIASAVDAFFFIQSLRFRPQLGLHASEKPEPNRIDPERLNEVDRRILKESFRQARHLQSRLALDYQL